MRTRTRNQQLSRYTELWIIGTPEEVTTLVHLAKKAGQLVYASAPTPVGGGDPRMRRYLRLRSRYRQY